jgi:orotidine-5'-phosphate decarboxylase
MTGWNTIENLLMNNQDPKTIVALDYPDQRQALEFVQRVDPSQCKLKVGFELFVAEGPAFVEKLCNKGFDVFLDLKFHDIPNTVASACKTASRLGVWMMNVHASGGQRMMEAACEAVEQESHQPKLIAVTILTSMDDQDMQQLRINNAAREQALYLSQLTKQSGLDGVVCSAQEASAMRELNGDDFLLVTPGIRPAGADQGDQKRVVTPEDAFSFGSSYLVMGRPITRAEDPMAVLQQVNEAAQG